MLRTIYVRHERKERKRKNGPIQNEKKGSCREYEGERVKPREKEE